MIFFIYFFWRNKNNNFELNSERENTETLKKEAQKEEKRRAKQSKEMCLVESTVNIQSRNF